MRTLTKAIVVFMCALAVAGFFWGGEFLALPLVWRLAIGGGTTAIMFAYIIYANLRKDKSGDGS